MFKNYLKLALRNLWKRKSFTLLNIIGLSVAFGVAILLCTAAFFDLSYDKFHTNLDHLYKVYTIEQSPKGAIVNTNNPVPFAPALKLEVPGVKKIARFFSGPSHVSYNNKELNMNVVNADQDFFSMFTFPVVKGNTQSFIEDKTTVAITEGAAKNLFGDVDPLGKTILLTISDVDQPFTVSAVLKDMPLQSSMRFDMVTNFQNKNRYLALQDQWNHQNHDVYIQLNDNVSVEQFEAATRSFSNLHFKETIDDNKRDGAKPDVNGQYRQVKLMPFGSQHFATYNNGKAMINKGSVYMIIGVSLLILFIACVNFINMSIGTSVQRLREIGMRKTLGAQKLQLFFQFWGESLIVFLCAVLVGAFISKLLMEPFKTMFSTPASFSSVMSPGLIIGAFISFLIITFIAGGYPALLLSKLGTLQSLKGKLEVSGKNRLRNALIIVQFSIAILLIAGTLVFWSQLDFMKNKDLGFNKEQVLAFALNGKKNDHAAVDLLRNELLSKPGILGVTASDNILGRGKDGSSYTSALGFDYKGRGVKTNMLVVDYDYPETLDMKLTAGRSFNRQYGNDTLAVVINEAMAKELGEKDPLNLQLTLDDTVKFTVIGVMKDYNFQGLEKEIEPISAFLKKDWNLRYAYVKVAPGNLTGSFDMVKAAWKKIEPGAEFTGSFLDENIDRTFRHEKIITTIITTGAIVAIALSCVGLFAISLLVVAQRTKEIGVRKVVGASVRSITFLLSKDFIKLVAISMLIATPLAWWGMSKYLQSYAYRINLSAWFFIAAGVMAVLIAFISISFQTIKAATANPVKSLRTE